MDHCGEVCIVVVVQVGGEAINENCLERIDPVAAAQNRALAWGLREIAVCLYEQLGGFMVDAANSAPYVIGE